MSEAIASKPQAHTFQIYRPSTRRVYTFQMPGSAPVVPVSRLGAYPEKVIIGDYTRGDHPWLSYFAQSDWQGGGQLEVSQEATDISRYQGVATLDTWYPHGLTLLAEAVPTTLSTVVDAYILGDVTIAGVTTFWVASGTTVYKIKGEGTIVATATGAMTAPPIGRIAVPFKGSDANALLYVALGSAGYARVNPIANTVTNDTTKQFVDFELFDSKIWGLTTAGEVYQNPVGSAGPWTLLLTHDGSSTPRQLLRYFDQSGAPGLMLITDRGGEFIDPVAAKTYPTSLEFPPHPDAANASIRWREQLMVSYGVDTARYDGSTVSYPGLSRDYGVPVEYRGRAVSCAGGWNAAYFLYQGIATDTIVGTLEVDTLGDFLFVGSTGLTYIMQMDGLGSWHTVWVAPTVAGNPFNIATSSHDDDKDHYRLYWTVGGVLWTRVLSRSFHSPLQNPNIRFQTTGQVTSSWLDFNMTASQIILAAFDVRATVPAGTEVTVQYQLNTEAGAWYLAGNLATEVPDANETYRLRCGLHDLALPDGGSLYAGEVCKRMRYRITMTTTNGDASPLVENINTLYMKKMDTYQTWTAQASASYDLGKTYDGLGNADIQRTLNDLVEEGFVGFRFEGQDWRTAKVAGVGGSNQAGYRTVGDRELTLIEVWPEMNDGAL